MSESEKDEMINNALDAGPTIPFPNFAKLFKTWLEVLCTISDENRKIATPYETINFTNIKNLSLRFKEIILENKIKGIKKFLGVARTLAI